MRFDELLGNALKLDAAADNTLAQRAAHHNGDRRARLVAYRTHLVDGSVLTLPLVHSDYQFNPQTLVPLEGFGRIYPMMRITNNWGVLEVERDGALGRDRPQVTTGSAIGADSAGTTGEGW